MTENRNKHRDISFDILRIISCLMVVLVHVAIEGWYDTSPRTYTWTVLNFYDTLGRPSIPIFFMISGALFLRRETIDIKRLWLKNIFHISVLYLFWAFFYAVTKGGVHKALADPASVLKTVFGNNPQYHLWYLRSLMNLYAIAPLLWLLVRAMDGKMIRYYLGLFFVFGLVCKTVYELPFLPSWLHDQINLFEGMEIIGYSGYFMLGYFLTDPSLEKRNICKIAGIVYPITLVLAAGLNQWMSWVDNWPTQALYGNFSLPVAIQGCCLFLLVRERTSKSDLSQKYSTWIFRVSVSTLFVYLIHPFVIQRLKIYFHLSVMNYNVLVSVPLMTVFVFVISSAVGMILKKIPVLRWIV